MGRISTKQKKTMVVEMKKIATLSHGCDGCQGKDFRRSCCATYEVCISLAEMEAIVGVLPEISKFCPGLKDEDLFQNVFEETDDGLLSLDTTEDGMCVFAYEAEDGIRCGIHSAAKNLKIPPEHIKPAVCLLWPLGISDEGLPYLSIVDDAMQFHCNTRCESSSLIIQPVFMDTIEQVYGTGARMQIMNAVEGGCEQVTISPQPSSVSV
tara:strand:- start:1246 stop:1872 length:627 start_codon:yes stop_codon:yes gene_type:complete